MMLDEDEWTDRNHFQHESSKDGLEDEENDTSEDSFSDLETDSDDSDEESDGDGSERPLTANDARALQRNWLRKCDELEGSKTNGRRSVSGK